MLSPAVPARSGIPAWMCATSVYRYGTHPPAAQHWFVVRASPAIVSVTSAQRQEKQVFALRSATFIFALIFFCASLRFNKEPVLNCSCISLWTRKGKISFVKCVISFGSLLSSVPVCWVIFCVSCSGCACDRLRQFHRERVPNWDFTTSGLKEVYSQVS